jgi:hypothetical protein
MYFPIESSPNTYAPYEYASLKLKTRKEDEENYVEYKNKKSKERKYYVTHFANKYPSSSIHFNENAPHLHKYDLLYFNKHNIWYVINPDLSVIHQYGYGVLGENQYPKGTAQYNYIMDCCEKKKDIDHYILYDHLFDENDDYHG